MTSAPPSESSQAAANSARRPSTTTTARIALAGNPNCGKTTLFNAFTGLRYKVANYPGVTVEKRSGTAPLSPDLVGEFIDLPGIYSLTGQSLDEELSVKFLLGELAGERTPDIIISVVDATNLERNLYLTSQLIDLGLPVVVVLTMLDIAERLSLSIKRELLAEALGVPVFAVNAHKRADIDQLKAEIAHHLTAPPPPGKQFAWLPATSPFCTAAESIAGAYERSLGRARGALPPLLLGAALLSEEIPAPTTEFKRELEALTVTLRSSGVDPGSFEATERYRFANTVVKRALVRGHSTPRWSDTVDAIITHRGGGVVVFLLVMAIVFQAIFWWAKAPMDLIDTLIVATGNAVGRAMEPGLLRSLIVDGIIAGVGSVLVFIPQIALLFLFLGLLEESGYLSRAAFIMDRLMRQVGLQGRSFIPLLSSFACAIPGIMSTRTIASFSDRMVTILIAPLMSCSARLPVYTLLIAAFVPDYAILGVLSLQGLVLLGMYLLGVFGAALVAWLLKRSILKGAPTLFIMEMPTFKVPNIRAVLRDVLDRIILFIRGAGTVILACSVVLWFLATFPGEKISESYAAAIGHTIEPAIRPLGYNWEIGVGLLASFAAREVFISSLSTVYNLEDRDDPSATSLIQALRKRSAEGRFSLPTALSLMVFYVFACQCMSTIAVCRRETGSWKWPLFMFIYMTLLAYGAAFVTYQGAVRLLL